MKTKKIIATLLAAITLAVPFNCMTASAADYDPTAKETISYRYFTVISSFNFHAYAGVPDTTPSFYWDGSSSYYVTFDRTNYGKATVELHKVNYGYTGFSFVIDDYPKPSQYLALQSNLGPGYYYFIITTTSTSTQGSFAVGHY